MLPFSVRIVNLSSVTGELIGHCNENCRFKSLYNIEQALQIANNCKLKVLV